MIVREVKKLIADMDDDTLIAVRSGPLGDAYLLGQVELHPPDAKRAAPLLVFELSARIGDE